MPHYRSKVRRKQFFYYSGIIINAVSIRAKRVRDILYKQFGDNNIFLPAADTHSYIRSIFDNGYRFDSHVKTGGGDARKYVSAGLFVLLLQNNIKLLKDTRYNLWQPTDVYIRFPA